MRMPQNLHTYYSKSFAITEGAMKSFFIHYSKDMATTVDVTKILTHSSKGTSTTEGVTEIFTHTRHLHNYGCCGNLRILIIGVPSLSLKVSLKYTYTGRRSYWDCHENAHTGHLHSWGCHKIFLHHSKGILITEGVLWSKRDHKTKIRRPF